MNELTLCQFSIITNITVIDFYSLRNAKSVISVTTLLFADDVKMVSHAHKVTFYRVSSTMSGIGRQIGAPPCQSNKCNYIVIGRVPPLQLSLSSAGNSIPAHVIHNRTSVESALYRTTLHIYFYGGPFWTALPLNIIIIT